MGHEVRQAEPEEKFLPDPGPGPGPPRSPAPPGPGRGTGTRRVAMADSSARITKTGTKGIQVVPEKLWVPRCSTAVSAHAGATSGAPAAAVLFGLRLSLACFDLPRTGVVVFLLMAVAAAAHVDQRLNQLVHKVQETAQCSWATCTSDDMCEKDGCGCQFTPNEYYGYCGPKVISPPSPSSPPSKPSPPSSPPSTPSPPAPPAHCSWDHPNGECPKDCYCVPYRGYCMNDEGEFCSS